MKKTTLKLFAFVLALMFAVLSFPTVIFASTAITEADWKETTVDGKTVIEIGTKAGLLNFLAELKGSSAEDPADKFEGKIVKLTADIDMAGATWESIYNYNSSDVLYFKGTFDGQGHKISNLTITGAGNLGFVHTLDGATVQNVVFENASVTSTKNRNGVLATQVHTSGDQATTIKNVYVSGAVAGAKGASTMTGGLVGNVRSKIVLENVVSAVNVTGFTGVGGFFGHIDTTGNATLTDCVALGKVDCDYHCGGFVGRMSGSISMTRCVSMATLTAAANYNTAFFYGHNQSQQTTTNYSAAQTIALTDCYFVSDGETRCAVNGHTGAKLGDYNVTVSYTGSEDKTFAPILGSHEAALRSAIKKLNVKEFKITDYALTAWSVTDAATCTVMPTAIVTMLTACSVTPAKATLPENPYIGGDTTDGEGDDDHKDDKPNPDLYKDYYCVDTLPDLTGKTLIMDAFNNDASDSYDQATVKALADGAALSLKLSFTPPRTHLTFTFNVEKAGMYDIAVEYSGSANANQQRVMDMEIDKLGKGRIVLESAAEKKYAIITANLSAGEHTLTVYAPADADTTNTDGMQIKAASYTAYKVYEHIPRKIYNYECIDRLPDLSNKTVLLDAYNNDATDSFNQTYVQGLADYAPLALKLTFTPPRTHLTFAFKVEQAGTYKIALEYLAPTNIDNLLNRCMVVQVDDMGKEQISLLMHDANHHLVLTMDLEPGEHTLTVYAPENLDMDDGTGKKWSTCSHYAYRVWLHEESAGTLTMEDGAAVSMTEDPCLRFTATFSEAYYNELITQYGKDNIEFGMLLMPATYAFGMSKISIENLDIISAPYVNYKATLRQKADGSYYFYGVTTVEDNATQYAGIGYVKVTNGTETTYIYAEFQTKNVRSVEEVAEKALADTKTASESGYTNAVTAVDNTTVYSPYTAAAYDALKAILPKEEQ